MVNNGFEKSYLWYRDAHDFIKEHNLQGVYEEYYLSSYPDPEIGSDVDVIDDLVEYMREEIYGVDAVAHFVEYDEGSNGGFGVIGVYVIFNDGLIKPDRIHHCNNCGHAGTSALWKGHALFENEDGSFETNFESIVESFREGSVVFDLEPVVDELENKFGPEVREITGDPCCPICGNPAYWSAE